MVKVICFKSRTASTHFRPPVNGKQRRIRTRAPCGGHRTQPQDTKIMWPSNLESFQPKEEAMESSREVYTAVTPRVAHPIRFPSHPPHCTTGETQSPETLSDLPKVTQPGRAGSKPEHNLSTPSPVFSHSGVSWPLAPVSRIDGADTQGAILPAEKCIQLGGGR